jgi:predicted nucleic-acid-binding Zn-ribbon protein
MTNQKCPQCKLIYKPKENYNRGWPQIYCSVKCRNKAYQKRRLDKTIEIHQLKNIIDINEQKTIDSLIKLLQFITTYAQQIK